MTKGRRVLALTLLGLVASSGAARAGAVFSCFEWLHEAFEGFPSQVAFGAALPAVDPSEKLTGHLEGGGLSEAPSEPLGMDHIVLFRQGISTFADYEWSIEVGGAEVAAGVMEVGPEEMPGCTEELLLEAAAAGSPSPSPSPSPSHSPSPSPSVSPAAPPVAPAPTEDEGGFPWGWLIGGGGLLAAGGGVLLRGTGKEAPARAPAPTRAARRARDALEVALTAKPPGTLEKPVEKGADLELTAEVRNGGDAPVGGLVVRVLRTDEDQEGEAIYERAARGALAPGASRSTTAKLKAPRGRPVGPGLTSARFIAVAEADGGRRAESEEVKVHVGHPELIVSLEAAPGGRVREGDESRYTVKVGNVGRAEAKDLEGTLRAECAGRRSKDSWERSFEVEKLGAAKTHEEEFAITPSALGEARGARLEARVEVKAEDVDAVEGKPVVSRVTLA